AYSAAEAHLVRLRRVLGRFQGLILNHFHRQGRQESQWTSLIQHPGQARYDLVGRPAATAYSPRYLAASLSARIEYLLGGRNGPHVGVLLAKSLLEADAALLLAPCQRCHREWQFRVSLPSGCCAYAHTFFEVRFHSIMLHIWNCCYSEFAKQPDREWPIKKIGADELHICTNYFKRVCLFFDEFIYYSLIERWQIFR